MSKPRDLSSSFAVQSSTTNIFNNHHGIRLSAQDTDENSSSKLQPPQQDIIPTPNKITLVNIMLVIVSISFILLLAYTIIQELGARAKYDPSTVTGVVLITNDNEAMIEQSIRSLNKDVGKYFGRLIVGCNRNISIETLSKIGDVQWVFTKKNLDFSFLDQLLQLVRTQYFFYSTTQWHSKNNQFIQNATAFLYKRTDITEIFVDPTSPTDGRYQERPVGFTLYPSLHRLADYSQIGGGYSSIVGSECLLGTECAKKISQFYFTKGLHAAGGNFDIQFYSSNNEQQGTNNINPDSSTAIVQNEIIQEQKPFAPLDISKIIKKQKIEIYYEPQPQKVQNKQVTPANPAVNQVLEIEKTLIEGPQISNSQVLTELKQMPFCLLLVMSEASDLKEIRQSIKNQKYSNYRLIQTNSAGGDNQNNYFSYRNVIQQVCTKNSIVLFVNSPLQPDALNYLNDNYQRQRIFLTYGKSRGLLEIYSFFARVYELLDTNDFLRANQKYLTNNNRTIQLLGLLQLSTNFTKLIEKDKIFSNDDKQAYFSIPRNPSQQYKYNSYVKLLRLSQDMVTNVVPIESWRNSQMSKRRSPRSNLTEQDMLEAIQRQEEWYLPQNHSIQQLEFMKYNKKFHIGRYQRIENQVPFCLTILSHNNIQNNRYSKAIESIIQQKYENYHIVFIDDASQDDNLQASRKYFNEVGFPKQRITYIKNMQRNYATYNILNAAFNYCKEDDIQMIMDGDDEFVGKYAFQVMNAAYQQNPDLWVAYSNYKTSSFDFGRSLPFTSQFEHVSPDNKRLFVSAIGPIRTWRVKLLYNIPAKHHKMQNGDWLDTVYDDALQHPLVELSTIKRLKYINQILYEYNVKYGDNDDSTVQKINHRTTTFRYILTLDPLKPLSTLTGSIKDPDVDRELVGDAGVKYIQLKQ